MRWPWRARPGMVKVSRKRLIELQAGALRARELQDRINAANAQTRAYELLAAGESVSSVDVESRVARESLGVLPFTADGQLHEPAFRALHQGRLWAAHEDLLLSAGGAS